MGAEFTASAKEAGIHNVQLIQASWPSNVAVHGDVALVCHVTYFVRDLVPFIEALQNAASRRVIISVASVPPPNQGARLFELLNGEPLAPVPGHRELLPVLWEMGLLPEVTLVPPGDVGLPRAAASPTREEAIKSVMQQRSDLSPQEVARRQALIEAHFNELFVETAAGFVSASSRGVRQMLITWEAS